MENELCSASHKVFRIKYHFVFCIKYRKDLFLEEKYIETIKKTCEEIQKRYYVKFETIGFDEDYAHFIFNLCQSILHQKYSKL